MMLLMVGLHDPEVFSNLNDPMARLDAPSDPGRGMGFCLSSRFGLCRLNTEI